MERLCQSGAVRRFLCWFVSSWQHNYTTFLVLIKRHFLTLCAAFVFCCCYSYSTNEVFDPRYVPKSFGCALQLNHWSATTVRCKGQYWLPSGVRMCADVSAIFYYFSIIEKSSTIQGQFIPVACFIRTSDVRIYLRRLFHKNRSTRHVTLNASVA